MTPCRRRCWACGNVADHEDNITPHVNCKQCGSQDTRLVRMPLNKFDAAKRYDAGVRFALCRDGHEPDWNDKIFHAGYTFAAEQFKQALFTHHNSVLKENGYDAIGIIKLVGSE